MRIRFREAIESRMPVWPEQWAGEAGIAFVFLCLALVLLYAGLAWWIAIPIAVVGEAIHIWNLG